MASPGTATLKLLSAASECMPRVCGVSVLRKQGATRGRWTPSRSSRGALYLETLLFGSMAANAPVPTASHPRRPRAFSSGTSKAGKIRIQQILVKEM